ncbi:hypothetical protein GTY67_13535 [Streptomyces sp. SID8374]|uniref:hypothetical protein n=1 Tax=Streptomyces sp. SID8374 TaxID=2690354 RepID=UPI0013686034|nr:hypothetical protein [Streptomyces sp. SID8374]MYX14419.1 hypothetical protein [Streptomyces sp. SID8374]
MTTSSPQVNGHRRRIPVITEWQTLLTPAEEPVATPALQAQPELALPAVDLVAQAEADAIRTKAYADAEEQRIAAEAEAKAIEIKAEAEAEKLRLANERQAMRLERDRAEHEAHLEDVQRKRDKAAREEAAEKAAAAEAKQSEANDAQKIGKSASLWRNTALGFAIMCAIVALPVQMSAFYNPDAKWLLAVPIMLEAGAWVILAGAAAAVAAHRPHWHYRLIAWALAFVAAGINLVHGLEHFDPATAIGTAFASLAGPGVWDLHEHGRIRRRDGVPTRRERRAAKKAEKKQAAEQAAAKLFEAERQAHLENAARDTATKLDADRKRLFPKVHQEALKLAADLGETVITPTIWKQAKRNVEGTDPGESADTIRMRNAAEMRVEAARIKKPVSTLSKTMNAQRGAHLPPASTKPRPKPIPPRRRRGDSTPFHPAAKRLAADTARRSVTTRINPEEN